MAKTVSGQATPSPKPFSPDGAPLKILDRTEWTLQMETFAVFVRKFASTAGLDVGIAFTPDVDWEFQAVYQRPVIEGTGHGEIIFNAGRLGSRWFEQSNWRNQIELLIHELGHHRGQPLDSSYHEALCRIGRAAVEMALDRPELFPER